MPRFEHMLVETMLRTKQMVQTEPLLKMEWKETMVMTKQMENTAKMPLIGRMEMVEATVLLEDMQVLEMVAGELPHSPV